MGTRRRVGLDTKNAAIRRAIFRNPETIAADIREMLKRKEKPVETTIGSVRQVRAQMRRNGIGLPVVRKMSPRSNLDEMGTKIKRKVFYNPRSNAAKIKAMLKKDGITASITTINKVKYRMRKEGWQLPDIRGRKATIPELSVQQERLKAKAMPDVKNAIRSAGVKHRFWRETSKDFEAYVLGLLPRWITKYDPQKKSLKSYIYDKVYNAARDFIRSALKERLGLKYREASRLTVLIRGVMHGKKTLEETARERKIPLKEAQALWGAYESYRRLGQLPEEK